MHSRTFKDLNPETIAAQRAAVQAKRASIHRRKVVAYCVLMLVLIIIAFKNHAR